MGGLGLAGVVIRPAGEEPSLFMAGLTGEQGVDLPEDGRDCSRLTGILLGLGNWGSCLPVLLGVSMSHCGLRSVHRVFTNVVFSVHLV